MNSILYGSKRAEHTPSGELLSSYRMRHASFVKPSTSFSAHSTAERSEWEREVKQLAGGQTHFTQVQVNQLASQINAMVDSDEWTVKPLVMGVGSLLAGLVLSAHIDGQHVGILFKSCGVDTYCIQSMIYGLPNFQAANNVH